MGYSYVCKSTSTSHLQLRMTDIQLPYGTMTDDEMRQMPIPSLQPDWGILCLWVTGRAMELGRELFQQWGYRRVDELVWVKVSQLGRLIRTGRTGHWLKYVLLLFSDFALRASSLPIPTSRLFPSTVWISRFFAIPFLDNTHLLSFFTIVPVARSEDADQIVTLASTYW